MGTLDSLGTTVTAELQQVVQGGFRTRQDNDVGTADVCHIVGIEQVDAWVALQCVEVGEVGDMAQQYDSHIHLALSQFTLFLFKAYRVLLFNIDIFEIWYNTQDGDATDVFQHASPLIEKTHIATELVDDNTFDKLAVLRCLQHDAAINGSKDAASINVTHQDDVSISVTCHRKIHKVSIPQIHL